MYVQDFDVIAYLQDRGIPCEVGPARNIGSGYVGLSCPFCGDLSTHLGINLSNKLVSCFRCGGKSLTKLIQALEGGCSVAQANTLIHSYRIRDFSNQKPARISRTERFSLPPEGKTPLPAMHRAYLEGRGFDPDRLERDFLLQGITIGTFYKYRLVLPVVLNAQVVTFQTLDVTGKQSPKYKGCPIEKSITPIKQTLYNLDTVLDIALVVEGATDVWTFGSGCVGTWGIKFTAQQVQLLLQKRPTRVFIMFDGEDEEEEDFEDKHVMTLQQAEKMAWALKVGIPEVELLELPFGDPNNIPEADVQHLRRELGL